MDTEKEEMIGSKLVCLYALWFGLGGRHATGTHPIGGVLAPEGAAEAAPTSSSAVANISLSQ